MLILPRLGRGLFALSSLLIALVSISIYVAGGLAAYPAMQHHIGLRDVALTLHIFASCAALGLMPFQFWTRLRVGRPAFHRYMGRIYAASVLVGGVTGGYVGLFANGGFVARSGFTTLAGAWVLITGVAVMAARAGDIEKHRRWIVYSAALTFAAVTLRLQLPAGVMAGMDISNFYHYVAWSCWVPNLMAVWLWRQFRK